MSKLRRVQIILQIEVIAYSSWSFVYDTTEEDAKYEVVGVPYNKVLIIMEININMS